MKIHTHLLVAISALASSGAFAWPVSTSCSTKVSYARYQVYRVSVSSAAELDAASRGGIELRRRRSGDKGWAVDVAVAPGDAVAFEMRARRNNPLETLSRDLGAELEMESARPNNTNTNTGEEANLEWFDSYHAWEEHMQYWRDLTATLPFNSDMFSVGQSFEGRPIDGIRLRGSDGKNGKKPAILFHGNVHAREWITSMVVEYIAYQLVMGYRNNDTLVHKVLDKYDFHILPIVNPDGFVYTQTTDRLWRKNRQVRANTSAVGTDINRNWAVGFGGAGSSRDPGSETFGGYAAFDAPETEAMAAHVRGLSRAGGEEDGGIKLFVDWHSYAQTILLSYGYSCDTFPPNVEEQKALAAGVAGAIRGVYGTEFAYGPGCLVLYQSSGNGRDYVTDVGKAQYGWGIELRDTRYGFVLPPDQILPSAVEIWEGLKYAWDRL
ncbi:hypothetical protein F4808DRAFT_466409 [Astrocystis sublimbata]|nr:hypothetical protein F4808DRAFT_466409 [Astrocystis sublimbata]